MKLLLDTHTLLWLLDGNSKLSTGALAEIGDGRNEKWLSVVSLWEITIKVSLGKLHVGQSLRELFTRIEQTRTIRQITILPVHLLQLAALSHHHGDPFDRLIVAQALSENCILVSKDERLDNYGVHRLW